MLCRAVESHRLLLCPNDDIAVSNGFDASFWTCFFFLQIAIIQGPPSPSSGCHEPTFPSPKRSCLRCARRVGCFRLRRPRPHFRPTHATPTPPAPARSARHTQCTPPTRHTQCTLSTPPPTAAPRTFPRADPVWALRRSPAQKAPHRSAPTPHSTARSTNYSQTGASTVA